MLQIREGVFETNSSSTHSICMCLQSDFEAWKSGLRVYDDFSERLLTAKEIREVISEDVIYACIRCDIDSLDERELLSKIAEANEYRFKTYEQWCDDDDYYKYCDEFTLPSGEKVVAFGEYGYDG